MATTPPPADASALIFLDTETTSLRRPHLPAGRRIWELAAIRRDPDGSERKLHALVSNVDLTGADPTSLQLGGFHSRHPAGDDYDEHRFPGAAMWLTEAELAEAVWELTRPGPGARDGRPARAHLVGAVPSFEDAGLVEMWARLLGQTEPRYSHHLLCVETLAAGRLGQAPPWTSTGLSARLGVDRDSFGVAHTAMADTRWARAVYDAAISDDFRPAAGPVPRPALPAAQLEPAQVGQLAAGQVGAAPADRPPRLRSLVRRWLHPRG